MRSLKRLAPSLLGLVGGGLGLLYFYEMEIPVFDLSACFCGWNTVEVVIALPVILGSLIGLLGSAIFLLNQYAGGTLLLAGGVAASSSFFYVEVFNPLSPVFFFLVPNLFFGLLLILGGLLAFPKTRHIIKTLHEGGWIP